MAERAVDEALLDEAADWLIVLRYGEPTEEDSEAFARWRQQSPEHALAWSRAETMLGVFSQVPSDVGRRALGLSRRRSRRKSIGLLGVALLAAPVSWFAWRDLSWRTWMADAVTAVGEQRALVLPDGSKLILNTDSAVRIGFTANERRVRLLEGEILVSTHVDPSPISRPFLIQTRQGTVRALGTRFSVRRISDDTTRVAVFEHAVVVRTDNGASALLKAGNSVDFTTTRLSSMSRADSSAALWEQGMLLANNTRLADVISEMSRYRSGGLRCDPAVADLRLSGSVSLIDTDAGLALLARSLPVRVEHRSSGEVIVLPR